MKQLRGNATARVSASVEESFRLLAAVDRYPCWNAQLFPEVEVLERDAEGDAVRARAKLRIARQPFEREVELDVSVRREWLRAVYLTRIPNEPTDEERLELAWRLRDEGGTRIELGFEAVVSFVPRFLPVAGVGDGIARSVLKGAATALGAP